MIILLLKLLATDRPNFLLSPISHLRLCSLRFVNITIDLTRGRLYCCQMPKPFFNLLIFALVMTVCLSARNADAWQATGEKIVVLTNRQTLQGEVTRQQGKVSVGLPSGSVIVLPDSRVEFVSESFGEAYWELAGRTRSTDLQGQIGIFKWCLRNELFEQAANHLLILQEMNVPAKTLMQLDVSLQITQKRHQESVATPTSAPVAIAALPLRKSKPIDGMQSVDAIRIPDLHLINPPQESATSENKEVVSSDSLPTIDEFGNEVDSMVRSVSWDQPVTISVAESELPSADSELIRRLDSTDSLVYADLDRLAHSMPRGSVGLFRKEVEPLVQKACSQCHGRNNSDRHFEIFQSLNGEIDRRMSQKNLYEALNLSDREHPSESLLIQFATTAHGGQATASFQWDDSQLQDMKKWLIMVSENPSLPIEAFSIEALSQKASEQILPLVLPPIADDSAKEFSRRLPKVSAVRPRETSPSAPKIDPNLESSDPFNAELFNRNFGSR